MFFQMLVFPSIACTFAMAGNFFCTDHSQVNSYCVNNVKFRADSRDESYSDKSNLIQFELVIRMGFELCSD